LAQLAQALVRSEFSHQRRLFQVFAFLGRYAHQQIPSLLERTMSELAILSEEIAQIMADEKRQFSPQDID